MIEPIDDKYWRTTRDLSVHLPGTTLTVPAGHVTDGASIPKWAWVWIGHPFQGSYIEAAIIHDRLCDEAWLNRDYGARVYADGVFYYLLSRHPVPQWKRVAMYLAVRLYGWWCYRQGAK